MRQCRIYGQIKFYIAEDKSPFFKKGKGLYIGDVFEHKNTYRKLSESEVLKIHEWLSRYINKNIHHKPDDLYVSTKAHARSIIRAVETLEANNE